MKAEKGAVHKRRHRGFAKGSSYLKCLFSKSDDKLGEGVKNLKKLMTSFYERPLI